MDFPESARGADCHAHVFSADAPAVPGARYRPAYAASLEAWMALWPSAGVTHGVLVQPSFFGTDNREMLAALARHPQRLRGIAVVDPFIAERELDALHSAGVRGVRLNLKGVEPAVPLQSPPWIALFDRVAARGWHVELFVDHGALPSVAPALEGSAVPLVLDHFGNPGLEARAVEETFAAAEALRARGPVWCKFSGEYRLGGARAAPLARRWLELLGDAQVVWGSDWPWTGHEAGRDYAALRAQLDGWTGSGLSRAVLWDNAARLYGFA